ncbi:MAG: hypothetical protein HPY71_01670 [Firmicutes bacterium]|nr:hypothetical protein [Bacillota bacterium]
MREAIRERLIQAVPDVSGRVYEPQAAGPGVEKPYLVVRQGVEAEESPWTGFRRIIEAWPYVSRTTFQQVDALAAKVIVALDGQLLMTQAGEVFTCHYLGTIGADFVDEEWDAITRGLQFAVMALQPVEIPETIANDLWLEALAKWTEGVLGSGWAVYRNFWPLGYKRPAVMWRVTRVNVEEQARAMFRVSKAVQGHVLGGTPNQEIEGAVKIVQELGTAIKIPLDLVHKRYLQVDSPAVDYRVDALNTGQVTATLSRMTARPMEEVSLMWHVYLNGAWR